MAEGNGRIMKILETNRLILRQLTAQDAPFILALLNDPAFLRFIGDRGVRTLDDARKYILHGPAASYEQNGFGLWLTVLQETGESIGICGLVKRPALADVDIGYAFLPQFTGKGYGLEAATAVLHFARTNLGLKRIVAITTPENIRSIQLLEKLGLQFEQMIRFPGEETDLKLYALEV